MVIVHTPNRTCAKISTKQAYSSTLEANVPPMKLCTMKNKKANIDMISELISYSKGFERYLTNDAAKHMRKVEDMSQGDEGRQRQFQKNKEIFNQIKVKWEKNKAEFLSNANPKKAVVVKNSLAYSGGLKIEIATLAHLLKRKYRLCKHMTSRSSSMTETNSSTRCMGN